MLITAELTQSVLLHFFFLLDFSLYLFQINLSTILLICVKHKWLWILCWLIFFLFFLLLLILQLRILIYNFIIMLFGISFRTQVMTTLRTWVLLFIPCLINKSQVTRLIHFRYAIFKLQEICLLYLFLELPDVFFIDLVKVLGILAIQNDCILMIQILIRIILNHNTRLTKILSLIITCCLWIGKMHLFLII